MVGRAKNSARNWTFSVWAVQVGDAAGKLNWYGRPAVVIVAVSMTSGRPCGLKGPF